MTFHLADEARGYVRFSLQRPSGPTGPSEATAAAAKAFCATVGSDGGDHNVFVSRAGIVTTELEKRLKWPRVWIHEGDYQAGKTANYGVTSADISDLPTEYVVSVDRYTGGLVTNWFTKTLTAPTFLFTLQGSNGSTKSWRVPAPSRLGALEADTIIWRLPDKSFVSDGVTYTWKVKPYNAANPSGGTEASGQFCAATLEQLAADAGSGKAKVCVVYPTGWAYKNGQTPKVRVYAYHTASFNGAFETLKVLSSVGETTFGGLDLDRPYYLMAFVDQNNNSSRDPWEPWGYYRDPLAVEPFMPVAVTARYPVNEKAYEIVLRDPDTDNDLIPDSFEYAKYGNFTTAGITDSTLRSTLSLSPDAFADISLFASAPGDGDGDGVNDLTEMVYGLDATGDDTDGDGINDGDEIALFGSVDAAKAEQSLAITGMTVGPDGSVSFEWSLDGDSAVPAASGTPRRRLAAAPVSLVYVIESTDSLTEPNWQPIGDPIPVDSLDGSAVLGEALASGGTGTRFFRIVLKKAE